MGQVPADEQTKDTLQRLKQAGAFARDEKGGLKELDPRVAAELIDGEKPALFQVGAAAALPVTNPLQIARPHAPLPAIGHSAPGGSATEPIPRRGSARPSNARHTEELMRQISHDLEHFNRNLVVNFENAKHNMQRDLLSLFDTTSREKLPDSFLKSLPKFGQNATKLHQLFRQSVNRKRTDSQIDRRDIPFELVVQPEVLEEIGDDITKVIDIELKQCCGEDGVVITDLQRILKQVSELMNLLRMCEKGKQLLLVEKEVLEEKLRDRSTHNSQLELKRTSLLQEMRDKDAEQDRLREKILRDQHLRKDRQRDYLREICRHETQLYEVKAALEESLERAAREARLSPRSREMAQQQRRDSAAGGGISAVAHVPAPAVSAAPDLPYDFADAADTQTAIEEARREIVSEWEEKLRDALSAERERRSGEETKLRIKYDEQVEINEHLRAEKLKLEMELVEKTKELRRYREAEGRE